MSRNFTIRVFLNNSPIVSDAVLIAYIKQAVEDWQGCYHPDDELFNNIARVIVTKRRKSKKPGVY